MGKHYLSLKDLKSPDRFFKAMLKVFRYLKNNVKLLLIIASVAVAFTCVIVVYNYIVDKETNRAATIFYEANKKLEDIDNTKNDERINVLSEAAIKVSGSKIAAEASYALAEEYYRAEKWDEAIKYYTTANKKGVGVLRPLSLLGLAYSYEYKGDSNSALKEFLKLKNAKETAYKAVAMLGIARMYGQLGETAKAASEYDAVLINYPDSDAAKMAFVAKSKLAATTR